MQLRGNCLKNIPATVNLIKKNWLEQVMASKTDVTRYRIKSSISLSGTKRDQ